MAKINLEEQLAVNQAAASHGDVIRQTLDALSDLREKGMAGKQYSLVAPFGRRAGLLLLNHKKDPGLVRLKPTFGA